MRLVKYVIVVAAGMLLLSSCASMRKGSSRFDSSESIYVKEEPRKVEVKQTAPEPKPEPAIVVREERVTPIGQTGPKGKYYIIIGSFQVLDNARRFSNDLTNEGFSPILLESEHGFFRVSVASFNDELDARSRLAQIRSQYPKYNDVWLLISL
ncbi:SPOR domain-containing protein [Xiashengella succiniciproducens]|jgi:cell division septation protein DedD|uniref:SPOR domain-containing protein n=1 Tax=Xiashengella succiniciproducens TaxID=2949635 RepID=A0A9J6ZT62_9BACT|nr:SPOR domain-containing protein [Alkaliflexus sp. Ai-910]MDI9539651.1 SPOR domain-containing protein [Bacteroidota bacterium]URW80853.1 SPOR domain-containing protein [Alkaliflexus sp. Ai-910]